MSHPLQTIHPCHSIPPPTSRRCWQPGIVIAGSRPRVRCIPIISIRCVNQLLECALVDLSDQHHPRRFSARWKMLLIPSHSSLSSWPASASSRLAIHIARSRSGAAMMRIARRTNVLFNASCAGAFGGSDGISVLCRHHSESGKVSSL